MNCSVCGKPLPQSIAHNLKYHKKCKNKERYKARDAKIKHFRDMAQLIVQGRYTLRQLGKMKPIYNKIVMTILRKAGKIN